MAQHDYIIDDATGAAFRTDVNAALAAIKTTNAGNTEPPAPVAGMLWFDTTDGTLYRRRLDNSAWDAVNVSAFASQAQAQALTSTTVLMSPARTSDAVAAYLAARPRFRAHRNGTDQTGIASNTMAQITWTTEEYDVGNAHNVANGVWTAPRAGYVELRAQIAYASGMVDGELVQGVIRKNGTTVISQDVVGQSGTGATTVVKPSYRGPCNSGDTFNVGFQAAGAGTKSVLGTAVRSWFEGLLT